MLAGSNATLSSDKAFSGPAEGEFLECLFNTFKEMQLRYAVLRNYETLPQSANHSDLDILVHPDEEEEARAAIAETVTKNGGVIIGYAGTVGFFKVFSFGVSESDSDNWWGLRLDISVGLRYAGVAHLVDYDILRNRYSLHNGIRVLPGDLAAVLGVAKELLHNDILPSRYLAAAADAAKNRWDELCVDLSPMGEPALKLLRNLCLDSSDSPAIASKSRILRRALLRTAFERSAMAYLRLRFLHAWAKVRRIASPPGMVVVVLGPDGVGKSTIIAAIGPILSAATHGAFIVKHLRPGLLPPLAQIKGKQTASIGPVKNPHESKTSGVFGSLFRSLYLLADYILGYWLIVRPQIAKSPAIILFDRYAYDMALDPHRFRIDLRVGVLRWLTRFAPKPDLIICLHGDPALVASRKQELPVEEVTRQMQALKTFAQEEPRAVLISTEGSVLQTRDDVLRALKKRIRDKS